MASAADQPLKKRRICDAFVPDPNLNPQQPSVSPTPTPPAPSQEEIIRKHRNREEIRKVYDCYRRIRYCVAQKDPSLMPDLEQAYLSLITASRGCTSVQRIVCELIPRYASHCPTALEAAAKVSINMYNWNLAIIIRGEDVDGVAYHTAKSCIFGLVDICRTATYEAPTSSVIQGICAAVFLSVLTFFTSSFEEKDIYHIGLREFRKLQEPIEFFGDLKEELENDNPALDKLFKFRALSLLWIFFSSPKDLLEACFKVLASSGNDNLCKKGLYFLAQVISELNADEVAHSSEKTDNESSPCMDSVRTGTESKQKGEAMPLANDNSAPGKVLMLSMNSFMKMAINRDPSLRGWICSRYKKFSESLSSEAASEVSSFMEKACGAPPELVQEMEYDGNNDNADHSKFVNCHSVDKIPMQHHVKGSGKDSSLVPHRSCGKISEDTHVANASPMDESKHKNPCPRRGSNETNLVRSKFLPSAARRQLQHNSDYVEGRSDDIEVGTYQGVNVDIRLPATNSASVGTTEVLPSSKVHSNPQYHISPNQTCWYSDGDLAAMNVWSASKHLWIGSLGHDASETLVRMQFEDFGPIDQFLVLPAKDFALIGYRNIMDAVNAREYMQGSSIWGGSLCIKFLDIGLGSKGNVRGIPFGDSCQVYIGTVTTKSAKDELLNELMAVGLSKPRMVVDLKRENALLLEFVNAEEAAIAMTHIRKHRQESRDNILPKSISTPSATKKDVFNSGCQLLIRQIDISVPDEELINAFSRYGELTGWQFMRQTGCCLIDFRSYEAADLAKCHLDGARFGVATIRVEFRSDCPGSFPDRMVLSPHAPTSHERSSGVVSCHNELLAPSKSHSSLYVRSQSNLHHTSLETDPGSRYAISYTDKPESNIHELISPRRTQVQKGHPFQTGWAVSSSTEMLEIRPSFAESPATTHADGHIWQHKKHEIEPQVLTHGILHHPALVTPRGSIIPPPSQASPYIRPSHITTSSWENPFLHENPLPARTMPSDNPIGNPHPPRPFIPSSITPLSQLPVSSLQCYSQMVHVPGPTVSTPTPAPPDAPPPFPSPPPPPLSQPPSVPPPPSSPPPVFQPGVEMSNLKISEAPLNHLWEGNLSKSGVHYCSIYATREDSNVCKYSNAISEPADWPTKLDVTKRADFRHVKTTFMNTPCHKREACRLLPSTANDNKGIHDFISYLRQRDCAGVIKIPAGKSMWARLLFILPYSLDVCSLLGIATHPADCLIALVLPKETNSEWLYTTTSLRKIFFVGLSK